MSIVTEFLDQRGLFVLYLWDIAWLQEGGEWFPLRTWQVTYRADPLPNIGWGVKLGTYGGRQVVEVSNDGTDTYAKVEDTLTLGDGLAVSVSTLSGRGLVVLILLFAVGLAVSRRHRQDGQR